VENCKLFDIPDMWIRKPHVIKFRLEITELKPEAGFLEACEGQQTAFFSFLPATCHGCGPVNRYRQRQTCTLLMYE